MTLVYFLVGYVLGLVAYFVWEAAKTKRELKRLEAFYSQEYRKLYELPPLNKTGITDSHHD